VSAKQQVQVIEHQPPAPLTPMELVQQAIEKGASVEVIGRMMDFQERWDRNQAAKEFNTAIAAAKAEIKPIARNKEGHNSKRYVDMAAVANAVDPILSKHGLGYRYRSTQSDRITVTCVLFHRAGHSEETTLTGPADTSGNKNAIQAIGSAVTYLQRYTLKAALGLAASEDDDGRGAGGGDSINDEQAHRLLDLMNETGADAARFCRFFKIGAVPDLPAARFDEATRMLNAKRRPA
jgi:hypothetical protein